MTPRHADVAFVLEGVEGVRAVYAIDPGKRAAQHFDFAVEIAPGGRALALACCALLRVLTHEDCARVFLFHTTAPQIIAEAVRVLSLTSSDREAARRRVPPVPPAPAIVSPRAAADAAAVVSDPVVLVVGADAEVERVVTEVLVTPARSIVAATAAIGAEVAASRSFDLILCDARLAFGTEGLLAKLPLDVASRVLVLASSAEAANARWRLQGTARILRKPLEGWVLRERITRLGAVNLLWGPDLTRAVSADAPVRRLTTPPASAPFTVLLADVDHDVHDALRRIFRKDSRHMMRREPEEAVELALTMPFHLLVCSASAALRTRSFLDGIGREDPSGADRVLVVGPTRDVPYLKDKLERMGRKNTVLAIPIDDATLQREVFRDHPQLAARVAVADVADVDATVQATPLSRPRFRRLTALVVDDDRTTEILFAAAPPHESADIVLATSPMEAFEHVVSRPVDLLVVSATMRGDGGEPFYRVLWRLKPELKSRCVLVLAPDAVPPSGPRSTPSRIVERPLTREAIGRVVESFSRE
jgi:CheY-like chemotaxis protein